jgi:hypothetical protein
MLSDTAPGNVWVGRLGGEGSNFFCLVGDGLGVGCVDFAIHKKYFVEQILSKNIVSVLTKQNIYCFNRHIMFPKFANTLVFTV